MKRFSIITLTLITILGIAGCAKAPVDTLDQAQASLQAAQDAEANLYLVDMYQAAADSFAAAEAEIAIQDARNAIVRNYDRVESLLAFVIQTADSSASGAAVAKEMMAAENEVLFQEVETAIAEVNQLMGMAPRGKDGVFALASIRTDLTATSATLVEARTAQENGNVHEARQLAQSVMDRAAELKAELETAIQSANPGRRS
ncbi:MAG: hypothetical protein JJ896_01845 [Rhodothermales bacterium]|nr:hypothetical protein [Rhodothermales bacterium]MBO6778370.1 hypothetical protein [Rhodothermales bacterium]